MSSHPETAPNIDTHHRHRRLLRKRWLRPGVFLAWVAAPTLALALMPPHVDSTEPKNGGTMVGNVVLFHGYSLDYADREATVVDLNAAASDATKRKTKKAKRGAAKKGAGAQADATAKVAATVEVSCEWVGDGDCAGCKQQKCTATVTLAAVVAGHRYKVTYVDTTVEVVAGPTAKPVPTKPVPTKPVPKHTTVR
jgi:hypothetical protein